MTLDYIDKQTDTFEVESKQIQESSKLPPNQPMKN